MRFLVPAGSNALASYPFATRPNSGVAANANNDNRNGHNLHLRVACFREPPKADIAECDGDVRFVPKADICPISLIDEDYVPAPGMKQRIRMLPSRSL